MNKEKTLTARTNEIERKEETGAASKNLVSLPILPVVNGLRPLPAKGH